MKEKINAPQPAGRVPRNCLGKLRARRDDREQEVVELNSGVPVWDE